MKLSDRLENIRKVVHAMNRMCGVDAEELEKSGVDLIEHQICLKQCKIGHVKNIHTLGVVEDSCRGCVLLQTDARNVDDSFNSIINKAKTYELLE